MELTSPLFGKELLLSISAGDEAAFQTLFDGFRKKIFSFALALTHSVSLSEEVVQDVFYKVWVKREELKEVEHIDGWLKTIARNIALNYLRRIALEKGILWEMKRQQPCIADPASPSLEWKEYHNMLERAINALPVQQKKVYMLSRRQGMKYSEIAINMHLSVHTVKEYVRKAVLSIRTQLVNHAERSLVLFLYYLLRD